jgi:hypothetical protein
LVQKAALSSVKFLRLSHAEIARTDERQRTALGDWDKSHEETATRLATIVLSPTHPATELERVEAHVALQHNSAGLRLLAQAWDDLIDTLDEHHHWQEPHIQKAARLLGYFQSLKRPDTPPAFQNLAAAAATTVAALKTPKVPLSTCHCSVSSGPVSESGASGKPSVCHCSASSAREPVTPEEGALCVRALRQLADDERTRLRAQADHLWQSRESQSRAESLARALADTTPEGQLLQRYLNDAHRTEDQSLKALARHRRDQARERSEPPRATAFDTPTPERHATLTASARTAAPVHQTNLSPPPQTAAATPLNPPPTPARPPPAAPPPPET